MQLRRINTSIGVTRVGATDDVTLFLPKITDDLFYSSSPLIFSPPSKWSFLQYPL